MPIGVVPSPGRISQLRNGAGEDGLENQIRVGLVIDSDTIPLHSIQNAIQAIEAPLVSDADTVLSPTLKNIITVPLTSDADTVLGPSLTSNIIVLLTSDADTVPNPTLSPGAVGITVPLISDADTVGNPTLAPGAVTIAPPLISDADTVNNPTVNFSTQLVIPLVSDADTVPNPSLENQLQIITVPLVSDADTVLGPTLELNIAAPLVSDADTIPTHTVAAGAITIDAPLVSDADTVNTHQLNMNLVAPLVSDADTIPSPTITLGTQAITVPLVSDADTVNTHVLAFPTQTLTIPLTSDADTINTHQLDMNILAPLVSDADTVNTHQIDMNLVAPLVSDADTVLSPTIALASQTITVPLTSDADTVNTHTLDMNIVVPLTSDADTVNTHTVTAPADPPERLTGQDNRFNAFSNSFSGSYNSGTTGSDRVLIVIMTATFDFFDTAAPDGSATYNGVSMTRHVDLTEDGGGGRTNGLSVFSLAAPATGSNTLEVDVNGSGLSTQNMFVQDYTYEKVDQTTPVEVVASDQFTGSTAEEVVSINPLSANTVAVFVDSGSTASGTHTVTSNLDEELHDGSIGSSGRELTAVTAEDNDTGATGSRDYGANPSGTPENRNLAAIILKPA